MSPKRSNIVIIGILCLIFILAALYLIRGWHSNLEPLAEHLKRNGEYTLCKPFRDGNGPGYIFTYSKNGKGETIQRAILHAENAYSSLKVKRMPAVMPDFKGDLSLDAGIAATFLQGMSKDPLKVETTLSKIGEVEIIIGPLEVWQADESQLRTERLSLDAIDILRRYKHQGVLDGVYVVYEAVKAKSLTFRFKEKTELGGKTSLPEIVDGLSLDPRVSISTSGESMVVISPDNSPSGVFIGYKDAAIVNYQEGEKLTPTLILELEEVDFDKRKTLMQ